jgi:hypothetical protein
MSNQALDKLLGRFLRKMLRDFQADDQIILTAEIEACLKIDHSQYFG